MIPLSLFLTRRSTNIVATTGVARSSTQRSLSSSSASQIPSWATLDPRALGLTAEPYVVQNLCQGQWSSSKGNNNSILEIPHPLDREAHPIFTLPNTTTKPEIIQPFIDSLRQCPKTGLHNPFKNPERYVQYGEISRKVRVCGYFVIPLTIRAYFDRI